jgi:catechol 2,3-dioxygenase-like lactoylglutathione lyase family enzyme
MNFNHAMLMVSDLQKSLAFYTQLFGESARMVVAVDKVDHYARLAFASGNSLSLHASEVKPAPQVSRNALYFDCDVDAEYTRLQLMGITFTQTPKDQPWHWREAHLSDPDGNALVLFHDTAANRRVR